MINIRVVDASRAEDTSLRELDGFESHRMYVDGDDIVLAGKDMRGAIYALYSFSEEFLGVPPLWYFCEWTPEYKATVEVPDGYDCLVKSPDVRFGPGFPTMKTC